MGYIRVKSPIGKEMSIEGSRKVSEKLFKTLRFMKEYGIKKGVAIRIIARYMNQQIDDQIISECRQIVTYNAHYISIEMILNQIKKDFE
jgi:hypothetical protein